VLFLGNVFRHLLIKEFRDLEQKIVQEILLVFNCLKESSLSKGLIKHLKERLEIFSRIYFCGINYQEISYENCGNSRISAYLKYSY